MYHKLQSYTEACVIGGALDLWERLHGPVMIQTPVCEACSGCQGLWKARELLYS